MAICDSCGKDKRCRICDECFASKAKVDSASTNKPDFAMYILLEEGMIIDYGDEVLDADGLSWVSMLNCFGVPYREDHLPMRRKINTVEELFTSTNTGSPK